MPLSTCSQGAGIPLLGKSSNYPPARPNSRIDFAFDRAAFYFSFLPFSIPYPVPFRLLGDERKVGGCVFVCRLSSWLFVGFWVDVAAGG